jgi:hypothetical protein
MSTPSNHSNSKLLSTAQMDLALGGRTITLATQFVLQRKY